MWEIVDGDPPLVDDDWRAICQGIIKGIEGRGVGKDVLQVNIRHQRITTIRVGGDRMKAVWQVRQADVGKTHLQSPMSEEDRRRRRTGRVLDRRRKHKFERPFIMNG